MRRDEFGTASQTEIEQVANRGAIGYLGMHDAEGYPRTVPLNFVLANQCIYFHGAQAGEKFDALNTNPKVTFTIVEPYSMIPSYWLAKDYACPATVFYKSVSYRGEGRLIEDVDEKAMTLQTLMEKHQPEGNYRPITATDPMYELPLQRVSVFKITPSRVDAKFKFGQNFSVKTRLDLIAKLENRNQGIDAQTAVEIKKTLADTAE